ncbi:MAG: ECF RNA polymerase sigma factor SigR [Candidatus Hydrogenedentota bacterium]
MNAQTPISGDSNTEYGSSPEEFLKLVGQYKDEFYRYILRTVWDSNVAEDVFQAATLAAYENFHKFRLGTNFRAWMYRIITNKCYVANREVIRAFEPIESADPSLTAVTQEAEYGDVLKEPELFLQQCGDEIYRAFRRVSTAERACILLRAVERFSYQEIAEILEIPVGTVMTHLSRGRAKLRKELTTYAVETGIVRKRPKLLERSSDEASNHNKGSAL